ncbi:alpha/beta-hydrolase [Ramaria rubella]|nr:alpha/beta-hydrolase [Ramaria rubella]
MALNSLQKIESYPEHGFIGEINTDIPIPKAAGGGVLRANVYRPLDTANGARYPVLMTLGPYGKDVPYSVFHPHSWSELPTEQKSEFSAWETPEPTYWPKHGYVVVRVDERGTGQSPGVLDVLSKQTITDFKECIEWAASQSWSTGKVGLVGISYYALSQWPVAAKKPRGLACIIPWEGMADCYRDLARQGGILSNKFIESWYKRQVVSNQYGLPGKAARNWGPDTIECSLSEEELLKNAVNIVEQTLENKYSDDKYFATKDYDLADIEVPLLSVANWGGACIALHLRGNVMGYVEASSKNKWLHFITGRHDLPAYLPEYIGLQKSFLDAWLKGEDDRGWLKGPNAPDGVPAVSLILRAGNPGFNSTAAEQTFPRRTEKEWPIEKTQYTRLYLNADLTLTPKKPAAVGRVVYRGFDSEPLHFKSASFKETTEITGHIVANLVVAIEADASGKVPKDLDLFVTMRHYDSNDKEIFYTGTTGDPAPICKGWLRASLRAIDASHPRHKDYLPYRPYSKDIVSYPKPGVPFEALVELWPTNVVVAAGNKLVLEISSQNTQGGGIFGSDHPIDRATDVFAGGNVLFVGGDHDSWVQLPMIST